MKLNLNGEESEQKLEKLSKGRKDEGAVKRSRNRRTQNLAEAQKYEGGDSGINLKRQKEEKIPPQKRSSV